MPAGGHNRAPMEIGQTVGLWTIEGPSAIVPPGRVAWWCLCDPARGGCGARKLVRGDDLRAGKGSCRACAVAALHATDPARKRNTRRLTQHVHTKRCQTCGIEFTGTARQKHCKPACRPSAKK